MTPAAGTGEGAPRAPLTAAEREELAVAELQRLIAIKRARWQKTHVAFTDERRVDYLAALEVFGEHQAAADFVGIHAKTARNHRKDDKGFQADCEVAIERYRNGVALEVHRRAVVGWDKPVYQGGKCVGFTLEHSDRMLELLAKRHIPEFRDKVGVEHSGDVGITTGVLAIPAAGSVAAVTPRAAGPDEDGGDR